MKIQFNKIRVPNFVLTNKGKFSLAELDDEEFRDYLALTKESLIDNRIRQLADRSDA